MSEIRVGVVGTGGMAGGHVNNFQKEPDVRIVACCDVRKDVATAFAARHRIPKVYTDYREMLDKEDLAAITVVTNDQAHCPVSVAGLRKGLHVLCEKPMATSLAEAKEMYRTAKAAKRMNMIQFSYRPMAALEQARAFVADGKLGAIRHIEASYLQSWLQQPAWGDWRTSYAFLWRMSKKHGGGALADIGCHILDFTTYAAGDIKKLNCTMKSFDKGVPRNTQRGFKLDADDGFFATAEFASGAIGVIHASRWAQGHMNALRLRIFGDKGALVIDTDQGRDKVQVCVGEFAARYALWNTLPTWITETSVYARFIRSIRTGKAESPTFLDGLKVQTYLQACNKSAETGRSVAVKF